MAGSGSDVANYGWFWLRSNSERMKHDTSLSTCRAETELNEDVAGRILPLPLCTSVLPNRHHGLLVELSGVPTNG
uniref:Uncharacterized protein n=1 Tax=Timema shepardi TaxID=629360 RepID=A0A7R9G0V5_TIMSH|nr:unnamed protein product [Timema shepardi]